MALDQRPTPAARVLRYWLTLTLLSAGRPMTLRELTEALDGAGRLPPGRPSKVVSDALRWEARRGRVWRMQRGVYAPGFIPRSTRWWMRDQIRLGETSCEQAEDV